MAEGLAELKTPQDAYKAAGYVPHRGNANRLARRPEVRAYAAELLDEAAEFAGIRRVRVMVEIDRIGRANLADFFERTEDGEGVRLKNIKDLPRELTAALASLKFGDDGQPEVKLHDKLAANVALLKILGGLPDDDAERRNVNIFNVLNVDDQRTLAEALEAQLRGQAGTHPAIAGER